MNDKVNIGLCLSGGGARGFAHLGLLQAIDELAIPIAKISGSSAGALVAALYAEGHKPRFILESIVSRRFWKYAGFSPSKMGILSLTKSEKILRHYLPHDSFEGLKIPVSICTTNIGKGLSQYFEAGELIKPLLASSSIPVIFKPININGDLFIDGGLSNNLPLEPLKDCGYKIAVNVTPFEKRMPVRSMKSVVMKSIYMSVETQTKEKSKSADLIIEPEGIMRFDGMKLKDADKLFTIGYKSGLKWLKNLPDS